MSTTAAAGSSNRRRWSNVFKGYSSHQAIVTLDSIPEGEVVKGVVIPESTVPLSEFVLVITNRKYKTKYDKIKRQFFEKHVQSQQFELYPVRATHKQEFKVRFKGIVFEVGKIYKLHPKGESYVPVDRFVQTIDYERMQEALYILGDLGAQSILLNKTLYEKIRSDDTLDLSLSLPEATPVVGGQGASGTRQNGQTNSIAQAYSIQGTFQEPKYKPYYDDRDVHWYYDNGKQTEPIKELVPKILAKKGPSELELSFSTKEEHDRLMDMQIKLSSIVGVGCTTEHSETSEFQYSFRVKFFDEKTFQSLETFGRTDSWKINSGRKSLSTLASLRAAYHDDRYLYREDIMFANGKTTPISEWVQDYSESTWIEWISSQASSNVFTIPLVLYGEKGSGKTSVISTWDVAIRGTPWTFMSDYKLQWQDMVKKSSNVHYETFMKKVRFDPYANMDQSIGAPDDETYQDQLREKDKVRLLVHDTIAAQNIHQDVRGIEFPFGLRVLVLDANVLEPLADMVGNSSSVPAVVAKQIQSIERFLGPASTDGEIKRYPPICTLITKCNDMDDAAREKLVQFVETKFDLVNVFPMSTFKPPTDDEIDQFFNNKDYRKEFNKKWNQQAVESIDVFDTIIQSIIRHEFSSRSLRTRKSTVFQTFMGKFRAKLSK